MKNLIIILLISLSLNSFSQSNAIISTSYMPKIVYIGVNNPIDIIVSNVKNSDLVVSVNSGKVKVIDKDAGKYEVSPSRGSSTLTITVTDKKGNVYTTTDFQVHQVPPPRLVPSNQCSSLKTNDIIYLSFRMDMGGCLFPMPKEYLNISSFSVKTISMSTGKMIEISCDGNNLSELAKEEIKKLEKGDLVTFDSFVCGGRKVPNVFSYTIP
jgi:hypothetical protein